MSFREDIMGGGTQVSTMINGIRFFKEPIRQPGNEDIPLLTSRMLLLPTKPRLSHGKIFGSN